MTGLQSREQSSIMQQHWSRYVNRRSRLAIGSRGWGQHHHHHLCAGGPSPGMRLGQVEVGAEIAELRRVGVPNHDRAHVAEDQVLGCFHTGACGWQVCCGERMRVRGQQASDTQRFLLEWVINIFSSRPGRRHFWGASLPTYALGWVTAPQPLHTPGRRMLQAPAEC